eukprot:maker-scaffold_14-snap-gene-4.48-mRNA-1 protein AED:0.45 eAED:0.45 QI:0/0/0/1/1/1/2/0/1267
MEKLKNFISGNNEKKYTQKNHYRDDLKKSFGDKDEKKTCLNILFASREEKNQEVILDVLRKENLYIVEEEMKLNSVLKEKWKHFNIFLFEEFFYKIFRACLEEYLVGQERFCVVIESDETETKARKNSNTYRVRSYFTRLDMLYLSFELKLRLYDNFDLIYDISDIKKYTTKMRKTSFNFWIGSAVRMPVTILTPVDVSQSQFLETLVTFNDLFETAEYYEVLVSTLVLRYGLCVILFNQPIQAFTFISDVFLPEVNLNFSAFITSKLLTVAMDPSSIFQEKGLEFKSKSFNFLAFGGGVRSCLLSTSFCSTQAIKSPFGHYDEKLLLKICKIILINPVIKLDKLLFQNVKVLYESFSCFPETRNDLCNYMYCKYLFSESFAAKGPALVLNLYSCVFNPIELWQRLKILKNWFTLVNYDEQFIDTAFSYITRLNPAVNVIKSNENKLFDANKQLKHLDEGIKFELTRINGAHEVVIETRKNLLRVIKSIVLNRKLQKQSEELSESCKGLIEFNTESKCMETGHTAKKMEYTSNKQSKVVVVPNHEDGMVHNTAVLLNPRSRLFTDAWLVKLKKPHSKARIDKFGLKKTLINEVSSEVLSKKYQEQMNWRVKHNRNILKSLSKSATEFQRILRGHQARIYYENIKKLSTTIKLQTLWRCFLARKELKHKRRCRGAAIDIQRVGRGRLGRVLFKNSMMRHFSSLFIQRFIRGGLARRRVLRLRELLRLSAIRIQSMIRGKIQRITYLVKRVDELSAIAIQKVFRGFRGRQRQKRILNKYVFSLSQEKELQRAQSLFTRLLAEGNMISGQLYLLQKERAELEGRFRLKEEDIATKEEEINTIREKMEEVLLLEDSLSGEDSEDMKFIELEKQELDQSFDKLSTSLDGLIKENKADELKIRVLTESIEAKKLMLKKQKDDLVLLLKNQEEQLAVLQEKDGHSLNEPGKSHIKAIDMNLEFNKYLAKKKAIPDAMSLVRLNFLMQSMSSAASLSWLKHNTGINQGEEDNIRQKEEKIANIFERKLQNWSMKDVQTFLEAINLEMYSERFLAGKVDGLVLSTLSEEELEKHLSICDPLHRKKILVRVRDLNECYSSRSKEEQIEEKPVQKVVKARTKQEKQEVHPQEDKKTETVNLVQLFKYTRSGQLALAKEYLKDLADLKFDESSLQAQYQYGKGTMYKIPTITGFSLNQMDENGNTALLVAAQNGSQTFCKFYISKGAYINHQNKLGNTALHYAMSYEYYDLGAFLISQGADEEILNSKDASPYDGLGDD